MFSPPGRCEVENLVHSSEMKMRFQQDKRKRDVGSSHGPEVLFFVTKTSCRTSHSVSFSFINLTKKTHTHVLLIIF